MELIAMRTFESADQYSFAAWSGDTNPMHMSDVAARRTQAGSRAVHGVHATIWALDSLVQAGFEFNDVKSIKASFKRFIHLDKPVALFGQRTGNLIKAEIRIDDMPALVLMCQAGPAKKSGAPVTDVTPGTDLSEPVDLGIEDISGLSGELRCPEAVDGLMRRYPAIARALGERRLGSLALLSTLVGMSCPGLHSIFSGFTVVLEDGSDACDLNWRVKSVDDRYMIVAMAVSGSGFTGDVTAFLRAKPVNSPSMDQFMARIEPDEFAGHTALIIGGSRGLGAVSAKLLCAGGGRAIITYLSGEQEARSLVSEVEATVGENRLTAIQFDAAAAPGDQLERIDWEIDALFYFATPRIFDPKIEIYSDNVFQAFRKIYLEGFNSAACHLAGLPRSGELKVLYPSTVYIDERPSGMTEYAMTKAAGEVLAVDLAKAHRFKIATPRIPRVLTDQTATVPPVSAADPVEVMLPILRDLLKVEASQQA